jgi:prepilin-type processing-associated H-X9-DG protein
MNAFYPPDRLPGTPKFVHPPRLQGFALPELAAVVVVGALTAGLALLAADGSRRLGRIGEDLSHMRQIAAATDSYGADHEDRIWGFSWRQGLNVTPYSELAIASSDHQAAAFQLTHIVRIHGGRFATETPALNNLLPQIGYSQAPLAVYLGIPIPTRMFVSAADERWKWANDPRGHDAGLYTPNYGIGGQNWRQPYRGSFNMGMAFFDASPVGRRIYPFEVGYVGVPGGHTLLQRPLTLVANPSQKVLVHDQVARQFGRPLYHMDPEARGPVLFVDGHAAVRSFAQSNPGADPNNPGGPPLMLQYSPSPLSPDPYPPGGSALYWAGPQWTRMSLAGRDFGGPEVYP